MFLRQVITPPTLEKISGESNLKKKFCQIFFQYVVPEPTNEFQQKVLLPCCFPCSKTVEWL
jgi:hypothetical protein